MIMILNNILIVMVMILIMIPILSPTSSSPRRAPFDVCSTFLMPDAFDSTRSMRLKIGCVQRA